MPRGSPDEDFSNLPTQWSVVRRAVAHGQGAACQQEWKRLLDYYRPAITAYIRGACRDTARADELVQDFSVRFMSGAFRTADQEKGSFRRFLKVSLSHCIRNARPDRPHLPLADPLNGPAVEPAADTALDREVERTFLDAAWRSLRAVSGADGPPYYEVLKASAGDPAPTSDQLAEEASRLRRKPYSAAAVRQILARSRHMFAGFLYEQVEASLADPSPDDVAAELADLRLLVFCESVVADRRQRAARG